MVELKDRVNSVIIFLSQMTLFRWLAFLLRSLTVTLKVLLFWIYFFFLTLVLFYNGFLSIGNFWSCSCLSFHWFSVKHTTACPVSLHSLWLFFCWFRWSLWSFGRHSLEWYLSTQCASAADLCEFCECVQVGIDLYITHRKHQVKPYSSPWFSAACAAAIFHRNNVFCMY